MKESIEFIEGTQCQDKQGEWASVGQCELENYVYCVAVG